MDDVSGLVGDAYEKWLAERGAGSHLSDQTVERLLSIGGNDPVKLRARIAELEALLRRWRVLDMEPAKLRALADDTDAALGEKPE